MPMLRAGGGGGGKKKVIGGCRYSNGPRKGAKYKTTVNKMMKTFIESRGEQGFGSKTRRFAQIREDTTAATSHHYS